MSDSPRPLCRAILNENPLKRRLARTHPEMHRFQAHIKLHHRLKFRINSPVTMTLSIEMTVEKMQQMIGRGDDLTSIKKRLFGKDDSIGTKTEGSLPIIA